MANAVAAPLRDVAGRRVDAASPARGRGRRGARRPALLTAEDEAGTGRGSGSALAQPPRRRTGRIGRGAVPQAVPVRRRSSTRSRRRGIPYEVVGLGGLLLTPEVEDIIALLWVVHDPTRGDQLMRLLTGPLCRLGAADLDGLMAWARHQQRRAARPRRARRVPADATTPQRRRDRGDGGERRRRRAGGRGRRRRRDQAPDSSDRSSIVEAVDELPRAGWTSRRRQSGSATWRCSACSACARPSAGCAR